MMLTFIAIDKHDYAVFDEHGRQRDYRYAHERGWMTICNMSTSNNADLSPDLLERPKRFRSSTNRVAMNQGSGRWEDY